MAWLAAAALGAFLVVAYLAERHQRILWEARARMLEFDEAAGTSAPAGSAPRRAAP